MEVKPESQVEKLPEPPQPKRPRSSAAAIVISVLSLCIVLLLTLFLLWAYFQWQQMQTQVGSKSRQLDQSLTQVQQDLSQQQQLMMLTQQKIKSLMLANQHDAQIWVLTEAQYLVRLAAYNLAFENNTAVAAKLLELAEQKIAELGNPNLLQLQQVLSSAAVTLNATPKPDMGSMVTKINALSQQVAQLPTIPSQAPLPNQAKPTPSGQDQSLPAWKRIWLGIVQSFHDMLIIRHHEQPIQPLLPPDQKNYLVENIQIQLSLAQWAVLHQQPAIYQQSLQQAINWIEHYFVQDAHATAEMLKALTELQTINVKPAAPDLSDVVNAIQNILHKKSAPAQPNTFSPSTPMQESIPS